MQHHVSSMRRQLSTAGHWIPEGADEFEQLKHHLLMCLPSRERLADRFEVWKIDNAEAATVFERQTGSMLRVSSWYDPASLGPNGLESITQRGFDFKAPGGMFFDTGVLPQGERVPPHDVRERILVYCEVAVGRAFVYDGNPSTQMIPPGYDSFYIPSKPLDRNNDGNFSLEEYHAAAHFDRREPSEYNHRYFIQDPTHVSVQYIVRYTYVSDSSRVEVASSSAKYLYFDPVDFMPITEEERMLSNPSRARRLITIDQAFRQAVVESEKDDATLLSKKAWLETQLGQIDTTLRDINLNYANCLESLRKAYEASVKQLQGITKQKLDCILSAELELRRQYEQILWGEAYINHTLNDIGSSEGKSPVAEHAEKVDFLRTWKAHVVHRGAIARFMSVETDVLKTTKPDTGVTIDIKFNKNGSTSLQNTSDASSSQDNSGLHARPVTAFLQLATNSGLYDRHAAPAEELVSGSSKILIDASVSKLKAALKDAVNDSSRFPLPPSFTSPMIVGASYPVPGTPDPREVDRYDSRIHFDAAMKRAVGDSAEAPNSSPPPQLQNAGVSSFEWNFSPSPMQPSVVDGSTSVSQAAGRGFSQQPANDRGSPPRSPTSKAPTIKAQSAAPSPRTLQSIDDNALMGIDDLMEVAAAFPQYSLAAAADKKQKQLGPNMRSITERHVFADSVILSGDVAKIVYLCLPFFSKPPMCRLLYSTALHGRSLDVLYHTTSQISSGPMVIVIKTTDGYLFGAYLSHPLVPINNWAGSPASFIFSATLQSRIPYHGRHQPSTAVSPLAPTAFFADPNHIEIGNGDIFINHSLTLGSSELEGCYGVGFPAHSNEAKCFLAGRPNFEIEDVEVWSV